MAVPVRGVHRRTMEGGAETEVQLLTVDEYARLDEPDDVRSELVRGRLVREPRPAAPHGYVQVELSRRLADFVADGDLGFVLTDVGVVVTEEPPTVRGPDVLFLAHETLGGPLPEGFLEIAPDLAVEIVSPGNSASHIQEKALEYLDAGSRMVWVVDPTLRTATVYRSRRDVEIVSAGEDLDGAEILPGLRIPLAEILPG